MTSWLKGGGGSAPCDAPLNFWEISEAKPEREIIVGITARSILEFFGIILEIPQKFA
jgi:hypothetical protein